MAATQQRTDLEFLEAPHFIAIALKLDGATSKMGFRLSTNDNSRSVAIGECTDEEESLKIFFRSGPSPVNLERFYPQFRALHERAQPGCKLSSLPELIERLRSMKG